MFTSQIDIKLFEGHGKGHSTDGRKSREKKIKSPSPGGNQTHRLLIRWRLLYCCDKTTTQQFKSFEIIDLVCFQRGSFLFKTVSFSYAVKMQNQLSRQVRMCHRSGKPRSLSRRWRCLPSARPSTCRSSRPGTCCRRTPRSSTPSQIRKPERFRRDRSRWLMIRTSTRNRFEFKLHS